MKTVHRTVIACLGGVFEWAEFTLFGYLAYQISGIFFAEGDATVALIATYGLFAVGFLARPLGGLFFGYLGDQYGRKKALLWSIVLMTLSTVAIGCLPTYEQVGAWAAMLLCACRLIQGFAVAGEFNGIAIYLIEHANPKWKHLAGCWTAVAAAAGMLLGGLAAAMVSSLESLDWAWRIPFWFALMSGALAFYFRRYLDETPDFIEPTVQEHSSYQSNITLLMKHYRFPLLVVGSVAAFMGVNGYVGNLFYTGFLIKTGGIEATHAQLIGSFGMVLMLIGYPVVAWLADKYRPEPLIMMGLLLAMSCAPLIFIWGQSGSLILAGAGQVIFALWSVLAGAPLFKLLHDLFPMRLRYLGHSFAWSISIVVIGGTSPMVAQMLVSELNIHWLPGAYLALIALALLLVLSMLWKKRQAVVATST